MKAVIKKSKISGIVNAPPSKSDAHRLLICAGLCKNQSCVIHGFYPSEDILATVDCLRASGAKCDINGDVIRVEGCDISSTENALLDCRESGSTLRFFIPLCMLSNGRTEFIGSSKLLSRPLDEYKRLASEENIEFVADGNKLIVGGNLDKSELEVNASVSSQFVTGLMLYAAARGSKTTIKMTGVTSRPYIEMTAAALRKFGLSVEITDSEIYIQGELNAPSEVYVEGDWSGAAFFEAFNFTGGNVTVNNLYINSHQGDKIFSQIAGMKKIEYDITDCPDLAPIIMAVSAAGNGCVLTGTKRLAHKESNRGYVMAQELSKLGVKTLIEDDRITVYGGGLKTPEEALFGHNDHRIAMALTVLLCVTGGEIYGAECVKKSMPDFFERIKSIGAEVICVETDS